MEKSRKIKLILGIFYIVAVSAFIFFFFSKFTIQELTSYNFKSSIASEWLMENSKKVINHYEDNKYGNNDSNFKLMERIFHQKFGYGKIIEIDGDKATVDFEKAGEKKLILTFIEKI